MSFYEYSDSSPTFQEVDGSPSSSVKTIKFPNGTLTDNGDGSYTYDPQDITLDDIIVDSIAAASSSITIGDDIILDKSGTATAGTQYPSETIDFTCSVWDTDNEQAEGRVITMRSSASSGADGSEPYYLDFLDNDSNIIGQFDVVSSKFSAKSFYSIDDGNTGIGFPGADQLSIYAGNLSFIDLIEDDSQDKLQLGYNGDVDTYIGPSGKGLYVRGSDALIQLINSGYQFFYNETQNLADNGTIDLPNTSGGWAMVLFDNGAEYSFVVWTSDSTVTGISESANVAYTESDGHYCIYDNGSNVRIKNMIGSQKRVAIISFCR